MKRAFITGTAGFIGFHLAKRLLTNGWSVFGLDAMTDYYDVNLKVARTEQLKTFANFHVDYSRLENTEALAKAIDLAKPDIIVHLAAQAGVRYSIENPRSYIDTNLVGTFNVLEEAKKCNVGHLLMASTSSVYGTNTQMPFGEATNTDTPISLYAATKKANEAMAHSYAHLFGIPTTMFRFFTVYGPWGRPDLALFKFVKAAIEGDAIDVYNHGNMARDFTYVADLVKSIDLLTGCKPIANGSTPYRVVNIGNGEKVSLKRFIAATETALGIQIRKNLLPLQAGDVPETWANTDLLEELTGYRPSTSIEDGIKAFVNWYRDYQCTNNNIGRLELAS